ncbi:hypothetical protein ACFWVP_24890 [Streptomyces sp. NPDC058637]|uniref:hypothetical protein n=1 Tax=Streptomyces sp. NPDC058637 TaxID=3346569 RepID=UPI00364FF588
MPERRRQTAEQAGDREPGEARLGPGQGPDPAEPVARALSAPIGSSSRWRPIVYNG